MYGQVLTADCSVMPVIWCDVANKLHRAGVYVCLAAWSCPGPLRMDICFSHRCYESTSRQFLGELVEYTYSLIGAYVHWSIHRECTCLTWLGCTIACAQGTGLLCSRVNAFLIRTTKAGRCSPSYEPPPSFHDSLSPVLNSWLLPLCQPLSSPMCGFPHEPSMWKLCARVLKFLALW